MSSSSDQLNILQQKVRSQKTVIASLLVVVVALIVGYDKVSDELIWSIILNHLPKLKDEVFELLNNQ